MTSIRPTSMSGFKCRCGERVGGSNDASDEYLLVPFESVAESIGEGMDFSRSVHRCPRCGSVISENETGDYPAVIEFAVRPGGAVDPGGRAAELLT